MRGRKALQQRERYGLSVREIVPDTQVERRASLRETNEKARRFISSKIYGHLPGKFPNLSFRNGSVPIFSVLSKF